MVVSGSHTWDVWSQAEITLFSKRTSLNHMLHGTCGQPAETHTVFKEVFTDSSAYTAAKLHALYTRSYRITLHCSSSLYSRHNPPSCAATGLLLQGMASYCHKGLPLLHDSQHKLCTYIYNLNQPPSQACI